MAAKMKSRCQPAYDVIKRLGGGVKTAKICGISQSTVSRWTMVEDLKGTGGRIPQKQWEVIRHYAKRTGILIDIYTLSGTPRPRV
jgi:hypothetical protein